MEVVGLEVVLEAAVACTWREQQVDTVPQEVEGGGEEGEGGEDAGEVVEVLHRVHAQPSEWLHVGVAVVEGVDVGEERLAVQQAVGEVEVNCGG